MDSLDLYCAYKPIKKYTEKGPGDYKPFLFGNQYYVVSEQIIRHIQETLSLSIGMLTPSGEVMLISPTQHSTLFTVLLNHVLNQRANQAGTSTTPIATPTPTPVTTPATSPNEPMPNPLTNNFNCFGDLNHSNMQVKQTNWESFGDSDAQFPSCSKSTSCSELRKHYSGKPSNQNYDTQRDLKARNENACDTSPILNTNQCPFCCKLSARYQQKLRKLFFENDFLNENETTW